MAPFFQQSVNLYAFVGPVQQMCVVVGLLPLRRTSWRVAEKPWVILLKTALAAGHKAKYVLFDSWFSNPQQLLDIKKLGLNTIAMVKAVSKRDNEDDRTLGELFYIMISEVADITYHESMQIIVEAMLATVQEVFHIADDQLEAFYEKFLSKLPESMQRLLQAA